MALEEKDGKADQQPKKTETTPLATTGIDPAIQKIIDMQQAQIDRLIQSNSGGSDPTALAMAVAAAVRPLYEKMGESDLIDKDTRQFRFDNVAIADDPNDALPKEDWVSFVSYMTYNVITSDKRNGVQVPAPIRVIQFQYDSTKRIPRGKDIDMIHLCVYTCRSKKELKWLRDHTLFNVTFFDNIKGALAEEAKTARKMASLIMRLKDMNVHQLISMADSNNLTEYRGLDIDDLRATIAYQMAMKENQAEVSNQMKMLNEIALEQEFKNNIVPQ